MKTLVPFYLWLGLAPLLAAAPQAGEKLPPDVRRAFAPIAQELQRALLAKDETALRAGTRRAVAVLGEWAGVPEAPVRYAKPIVRTPPPLTAVLDHWRLTEAEGRARVLWVTAPNADPKKISTGLRFAGEPLIAYARLALAPTTPAAERTHYTTQVRAGADWLLRVQRPDGLFPFPDVRGRNAQFGPMVERLLATHPSAVADGWIVDDLGGDLKYDNAICGVGLLEAWRLTRDSRYLDAAVRAARWAATRPIVPNYNYNAFSAWLLAECLLATGDTTLIPPLTEHIFLGVLPGQMQNGRWFDQHNARLVYHAIIARGLLSTWRALPPAHPRRAELRTALGLTLDALAGEITSLGASSVSVPTEVLAEAIAIMGPAASPVWREAADINANAALSGGPGAAGLHFVNYVLLRQAQAVAP